MVKYASLLYCLVAIYRSVASTPSPKSWILLLAQRIKKMWDFLL